MEKIACIRCGKVFEADLGKKEEKVQIRCPCCKSVFFASKKGTSIFSFGLEIADLAF